jgi:hypothetical protein
VRLDEELIAVTRALGDCAIPYALVGGLAVAVWGAPRATKDIDLLVQANDVQAAQAALAARGFTLRAAPMEFSDGMVVHRLSKVEDGSLMTVDLLVVDQNSARYFESREERFTDAGPLWVIGRQALIAMKIAAGRPQDQADVVRLTEQDR